MLRDDTRELDALVGQLADQAHPRMAGSPAEATAAAYVNGRLRRAGMGVATYPLRVTARPGGAYVGLGALGLLAAAMSPILPLPSLLLALGVLAWLIADGLGTPIPPLGRRSASQTIIGVRAIEGAAGLAPRAPRWRVVLLAPLDSALAWRGLRTLAGPTRVGALGRIGAAALVVAGAAAALLLPGVWWLIGLPGALGCLLLALAALGRPVPSADDGGLAALAALLSVAQRVERLATVELWAVAVGAAGADPRGVTALLPRLPFDRSMTLFIGLEQLAGEQLVIVTRDGADELLLDLAGAADAADPQIDAEPRPHDRPSCLTAPLRQHGYRTLTILAHRTGADTPPPAGRGAPDPQLVERATRLVSAIIAQLERGQSLS